MNIISALQWRYSVKRFAPEPVAPALLHQLLEATGLSASAFGLQPYRLLLVESPPLRRRLLACSMGQHKVVEAPHLLVLAADVGPDERLVSRYLARLAEVRGADSAVLSGMADHYLSFLAAQSPGARREWAHQQAYIALGTLLTGAALLGIDSCPMTGIDPAGYDRELGLAEQGLTTTAICTLGYRHPEDAQAGLAKVRLAYDELVRRY